jgi:phosphonatase-like hydrolase
MRPELVLFDIAGTLIHDSSRTVDAYREVLDAEGIPMNPDWIREHIGCSKTTVFEELLGMHGRSLDAAQGLARRFAQALEASMAVDPPEPFPEVEHLLALLREAGIPVALITGFDVGTAEFIRATCQWSVHAVVGSDEVARGRPAPDLVLEAMRRCEIDEVSRVAVVGDTPRDLQLGAAAGCGWNIGVASGSYSKEELRSHAHTHVLASLEELPEVIGLRGVD